MQRRARRDVGFSHVIDRIAPLARTLAITRARADAEQARVSKAVAWSLEAFAGAHELQAEVMTAARTLRRILLMMARQAGKSWVIAGCLLDRALRCPGTRSLFLGLTRVAVEENFWATIWKPLLARWNVKCSHHEGKLMTTFPNGARVLFSGTDDTTHIKRYLGNRFAGCMIAIDEMQDQKPSVIRELLTSTLPPMLSDTSLLLLSGVIPEVPAGPFWDESLKDSWQQWCWGRVRVDDTPQDATSVAWQHTPKPTDAEPNPVERTVYISAVNVHTPEAPQVLVDHMRDNRLTLNDPQIERDWLGRKSFDPTAQAYRYTVERNGYVHTPAPWLDEVWDPKLWERFGVAMPSRAGVTLLAAVPREGIDRFSAALDPAGTSDRLSIEMVGWGKGVRKVQHVFELVTPKAAAWTQGQWAVVAHVANKHYAGCRWRYDAPSANEIDTFKRDYGLPVITCATKTDRHGQVRRTNDLLQKSVLDIMVGSGWEEDCLRAKRDKDAMERGVFEFDQQWHPDPAEAGRYSLQGYFEAKPDKPKPPKPATPYDEWRAKVENTKAEPRRQGFAAKTRRQF